MLVNISFKSLNKTGFVVFLLIQSAALYAEEKQNVMNSPQQPGSMRMDMEMIPPPPPGPYVSLAFSDAKQHIPQASVADPAHGFETSGASMQTFSPDVPWPDNIRETNPWMPENGYRSVQPPMQNMYRAQPYAAPSNNHGYGYGWPNMNNMGSQRGPAGNVPNAPYGNYPPGYGYPDYRPPGYGYPNYQSPANYNYYYGPTANPSSNTQGYPN